MPDSALGNNSESPVDAPSYKSVLSSRPPTAAGSDVPADDMGVGDRGADSYTSLLFSKHAWNPHDALLDLPSDAKSQGGAVSALSLDAEDEAFFSTLFDEVLNDAEQFTAGVGAVDIDLDIQPSFFPPVGKTLEEFDVSNVMYIASPELRDLVRRYPTRMKQELTESDVVEMTNATMTQVRGYISAPASHRWVRVEMRVDYVTLSSRSSSTVRSRLLPLLLKGSPADNHDTPAVDDHQRGYRENQGDDDTDASVV